jgi:hypothetical protein
MAEKYSLEDTLQTSGFSHDRQEDVLKDVQLAKQVLGLSDEQVAQKLQWISNNLAEAKRERARTELERIADFDALKSRRDSPSVITVAHREMVSDLLRHAADIENGQYKPDRIKRASLLELQGTLNLQVLDKHHRVLDQALQEDITLKHRYAKAMGALESNMVTDVASERKAEARGILESCIFESGGNPQETVKLLVKRVEDVYEERGHRGSISLDDGDHSAADNLVHALTKDGADYMEPSHEDQLVGESRHSDLLVNALPILAATKLTDAEYARYRVILDNSHLMQWEVDGSGQGQIRLSKLSAKAMGVSEEDKETLPRVLSEKFGYKHENGARMALHSILKKLNKELEDVKATGIEPLLSPAAEERLSMPTAQVVAASLVTNKRSVGVAL